MFSRHYQIVKVLFALFDALLISVAFAAAYQTRAALHLKFLFPLFFIEFHAVVLLLLLTLLCFITVGYWLDVYERLDSAHASVILRSTFFQCVFGTICLVLAEYFLRLDLSRFFVAVFAVYAWILLCLFRIQAGRIIGVIRKKFGSEHFLMIVGTSEHALRLGRSLEASARYGVRLLGFLESVPGEVVLAQRYEVHALSRLPDILKQHVIDEIIFAVDGGRLAELEPVFLLCDEEGVRARLLLNFFPHVNSELYLDSLDSEPLLTFSAAPHDDVRLMLKRIIDVILAGAMLLVLAPFMAVTALLIRLTSPGPAIFRQIRCGLNGRRFVFYKFRSMCENAEEMKAALVHLNQKSTAFKISDDPRLTSVGRFLRKFSIDEWPQLWNVLKGDMSLVGPRPSIPEEVELYQRWQRRRLRMRPGLTCSWAISGRDALDFETWMKMDMEYIDNWSLKRDWDILLRTIPHVLSGKGAH